jgi:hypothetical protein
MATPNVVTVLEQEKNNLEGRIERIDKILLDYKTTRHGFGLHQGGTIIHYDMKVPTKTKQVKKTKTKGPKPGKKTYSTMEMVRQVLDKEGKKGKELSFRDIQEAVRKHFKTDPASTLGQMLYKRSRNKSGFYRTANGKYGLTSWTSKTQKAA